MQAQLQTLASVCWSEPVCPSPEAPGSSLGCRWAAQGFPQGPALLTYLQTELLEGDDRAKALLRELFLAAVQPYMQHVRSWMYSIAPVMPAFGSSVGQLKGVPLSEMPDLLQQAEVTTEVGSGMQRGVAVIVHAQSCAYHAILLKISWHRPQRLVCCSHQAAAER